MAVSFMQDPLFHVAVEKAVEFHLRPQSNNPLVTHLLRNAHHLCRPVERLLSGYFSIVYSTSNLNFAAALPSFVPQGTFISTPAPGADPVCTVRSGRHRNSSWHPASPGSRTVRTRNCG